MDSRDIKDNVDNQDISEIEDIIDDGNKSTGVSWGQDCAIYLQALAKTQLPILKELRKPKECTCQK